MTDAATLFFERLVRRHAADADGRRQPEQDRRHRRHGHRKTQHAPVEGQVEEDGVAGGRELADENSTAPAGKRQAENRAGSRQHDRLGQQLTSQPQPRCTECQPTLSSWRLAMARARSRLAMLAQAMSRTSPTTIMNRHQRLFVAAAERGQAGRGGQKRQRLVEVASLIFTFPIERNRRLADLMLDGSQPCRRLLDALPWFQPRHDVQPPRRPLVEPGLGATDQRLGADRNRHVERSPDLGSEETGFGDADDREGLPLDR